MNNIEIIKITILIGKPTFAPTSSLQHKPRNTPASTLFARCSHVPSLFWLHSKGREVVNVLKSTPKFEVGVQGHSGDTELKILREENQ